MKEFWLKNGGKILTGVAVVGTISTAAAAATAGYKIKEAVDKFKAENEGRNPDAKEAIKLAWKPALPAALITGATIAAEIGAHCADRAAVASVTAAYGVLRESYGLYKNKIDKFVKKAKNALGDEKTKEIAKEVAEEEVQEAKKHDKYADAFIDEELHSFYLDCEGLDHGIYFSSTYKDVLMAEFTINNYLRFDGAVSLRDMVCEFTHGDALMEENTNDIARADIGWSRAAGECKDGYEVIDFHHHWTCIDGDTMDIHVITVPTPIHYLTDEEREATELSWR